MLHLQFIWNFEYDVNIKDLMDEWLNALVEMLIITYSFGSYLIEYGIYSYVDFSNFLMTFSVIS